MPANAIELVAVDLDGTLLRSDATVDPEGAAALRQAHARGIRVVVITARAIASARPYCLTLGLEEPVVCLNGAVTYGTPQGPILDERPLPLAVARAIATEADARGWSLSTMIGEVTYRLRTVAPETVAPHHRLVDTNLAGIVAPPWRMYAYESTDSAALRIYCETTLAGRCRVETMTSPYGPDRATVVLAQDASKGAALQRLCARLAVAPERCLALGDDVTDMTMFAAVGLSVAMGNASAVVRAAADIVAPSHDEAGVAWALRRFVLGDSKDLGGPAPSAGPRWRRD